MVSHMDKYLENKDIVWKQQISCHYCIKEWWSQDKVVSYMEMCTEDEDSWEDQNFKCPYCSQEIMQDDLIKQMGN